MAAADKIWRAHPRLAYRKLVDGGMLYDADQKQVHHFNETAALVWESCREGRSTAQIVAALAGSYAEDEGQIRTDVEEILEEFGENDLLQ
ncbi:MAG: PqqD family protein [Candidatus Latescibacteria bacterium]|jgi:hypothetical protein|nr:hypothetical protein [Gemmatimonadota bacterium]MDP6700115.1 PqqD family protein [Candidatus Latescibacterota bacterium]